MTMHCRQEVRILLAKLYRLQGRTAAASSLCERVIELDSANTNAVSMLTEIYKDAGRIGDADAMSAQRLKSSAAGLRCSRGNGAQPHQGSPSTRLAFKYS